MKWAFSLALLFFIFYFCSCENSNNKSTVINNVNNNLLTPIGDREITVNDFIKRCEYVPRPNYCKNNNYVHKTIALNSLIAEKLLAIEYEKKNFIFIIHFWVFNKSSSFPTSYMATGCTR